MAGTMYPPIFSLKLPVVKARVPNQKRPREWRVGLKILGDALVVDGQSEGMMEWIGFLMMLDRKDNEHTTREMILKKGETQDLWIYVCSDSFDVFRENKWRES